MFRTPIRFDTTAITKDRIGLSSPLLTIGSCFANSMGQRFRDYKFNILNNPFGTIFNPLSISRLLGDAMEGRLPTEDSYIKHQGLHYNYLFHSSFRNENLQALEDDLQHALEVCADHLSKSDWLVLTWGSAVVYEKRDEGYIAANCHKMPQKLFEKRLLTQSQIVSDFAEVYANLKSHCPNIRILLTVSPVRHIKEGLELNQVSKSTLRLACHTLSEEYEDVLYFPSYEMMLDDLRDYRFYKQDMIHPSEVAETYIWEHFTSLFFNEECRHFMKDWDHILKALAHRPFNPGSDAHRNFLESTLKKLQKWGGKVDIREEYGRLVKMLDAST